VSYIFFPRFAIYPCLGATFVLKRSCPATEFSLREYSFDIYHIPGKINVVADALSRMYPSLWGIPSAETLEEEVDVALVSFQDLCLAASQVPAAPSAGLPDEESDGKSELKFAPASEEERVALVRHYHKLQAGHFGTRATFAQLKKDKIAWPGMNKIVQQVCASCPSCQAWTRSRKGYHPARSVEAEWPWDRIQVDLKGPLDVTDRGYKYLMVVKDVFTAFTLLRCSKSREALEIGELLWQLFADFGVPKIIQTDGEGAFVSGVVEEMLKNYGAEHTTIAAYVPRINGVVERAVGVAHELVSKLQLEGGGPWSKYVPMAQLMLNTKIRNSTNAAPFSLFYNRALNVFQSYTSVDPTCSDVPDLAAWAEREQHLHNQVFPVSRYRKAALRGQQNVDFNARHYSVSTRLPVGAVVMVQDVLRTSKSSPPFLGPFTVARVSPGGMYTLKDTAGGLYQRDVPIDQLKPCTGAVLSSDPAYYVDKILDHRTGGDGTMEYLVQWCGFDKPSWESIRNIDDHDLIRDYQISKQRMPMVRPRPLPATASVVASGATDLSSILMDKPFVEVAMDSPPAVAGLSSAAVASSSPLAGLSDATKSRRDSPLGLSPAMVQDHSVVVPLSVKSRPQKRVTFRLTAEPDLVIQSVLPLAVDAAAAPAPLLAATAASSSGVPVATRRSSRPATQAKAKK
jgi:hypothetical protein